MKQKLFLIFIGLILVFNNLSMLQVFAEKSELTNSKENIETNDTDSDNSDEVSDSETEEVVEIIDDDADFDLDEEIETDTDLEMIQEFKANDEEIQVETEIETKALFTILQESSNGDYILKRGDKNPEVKELKLKLARIGFVVSSNPNNNYGPSTERVVKEFQEYYKLNVNGAIDTKTFEKIEQILSTPLQRGKSNTDVIQIKKDLEQLGFKVSNNPNTVFGPTTERVVKEFQNFYELVENGIVDDITKEKIDTLLNSPLKQGDYRKDVINLKLDLAQIGFVISNNPNPSFGPSTERTVKEFQRYYGLEETGVVDSETKIKINSLLESLIKRGEKSNDVLKLKQDLAKIGFIVSSNPNGTFGPSTERVIKEFQKYYSLRETGIVEENTLKKIKEILSSNFQKGKSHDDVVQLKQDLERLGFKVSNNPNRNYGPATERIVKEFQVYYNLVVNGIADEVTLIKIQSVLSSPLQQGKSHDDVIQLKKDLERLGFKVSNNPNRSYGPTTAQKVREFQAYYNLVVNGIADEITLIKIQRVLSSPLQKGKQHNDVIKLKSDLEKLGYGSFLGNKSFGPSTENAVKNFQKDNNLAVNGIADEVTLAKINELLQTKRYTSYDITLSQAAKLQMRTNPPPQTDEKYAYVHKNYINSKNEVTASALNVRKGPGINFDKIGSLSKGTKVEIVGEAGDFYAIKFNHYTFVSALETKVIYYLNPYHFVNNDVLRFQFLDLSRSIGSNNSNLNLLNNYLEGKGVLSGQGAAFLEAGKRHHVNEIYLISHAILETGHGNSALASGVRVGTNSSNQPVLVTSDNEKSLKNIRTVYNVYGIGAYDRCPLDCGAIKAYVEGWTSVSEAIIGGAKFIGEDYIHVGQNTLYKMRWNPDAMLKGAASHQYATDIGWAVKQVASIYNLYQEIGINTYYFDIPVYK